MSEPTRYRVADNQAQLTLGGGVLVVDPAGPLVEYTDYARLKDEVERLEKQVERLIASLQKSHDEHAKALYKLKRKK